jgi:hypothetical protein
MESDEEEPVELTAEEQRRLKSEKRKDLLARARRQYLSSDEGFRAVMRAESARASKLAKRRKPKHDVRDYTGMREKFAAEALLESERN